MVSEFIYVPCPVEQYSDVAIFRLPSISSKIILVRASALTPVDVDFTYRTRFGVFLASDVVSISSPISFIIGGRASEIPQAWRSVAHKLSGAEVFFVIVRVGNSSRCLATSRTFIDRSPDVLIDFSIAYDPRHAGHILR
jgi:hypothetical protein